MPGSVRQFVVAAAVVSAGLSGGCGGKAPAGPTVVRGTVTFQGQPVAGGLVVFSPDPDRGGTGRPARGELGPDGAFQVNAADGTALPAGWYRVAIAPPPGFLPSDRPAFPPQLARPDQSGLIREVRSGQENVFDFAVEVNPPR